MDFSIRGFVNPNNNDPFIFVMRTIRTLNDVEYEIDKFTFKPMSVTKNTRHLTVENESKVGGSLTTLTATYFITQILPSDTIFELTLPANNIGALSPRYTTIDPANYSVMLSRGDKKTIVNFDVTDNKPSAWTSQVIKIIPKNDFVGSKPSSWYFADTASPALMTLTINNFWNPRIGRPMKPINF